jgi:hypothetical protein
MLLGLFSRFQVACIFFWLVSFHHRNPMIIDAQDTVMRMLAFFFIFLPLDQHWSLSKRLLKRVGWGSRSVASAWALRLVQLQMSLIYLSATISKIQGETWQNGTALFYVYQLPAFFGKWPIPQFLLESEVVIRYGTWSVLLLEGLVPLALWLKPTRKPALILAIGLHLVLEYSMHTFLFQWIMIVGFLSFFNPDEWPSLRGWLRKKSQQSSTSFSSKAATHAICIWSFGNLRSDLPVCRGKSRDASSDLRL